jgi:succinate dehydrogenase / fumarate reductase cytochrome b subunit
MSKTMPPSTGGTQPIRATPKPWPFPLNIYQSAIGRKWVMAISGIALLGFVVVHMIGNLHVYEGPAQMAEYAESLRTLGGGLLPTSFLLWLMRVGLAAMFLIHIHSAYTLSTMSAKSSDRSDLIGQKKYEAERDYIAANYASRTMRWTGPIIALYLLFHLADLTWGWWLGDEYIRGNPYHNLTESLSSLPVALIYIAASIAVAIHVFHGAWSMFQSLGINNPRYNSARRGVAVLLAGVLLVGNLSFPILTQTGLINEDNLTCAPDDLECLAEEAH